MDFGEEEMKNIYQKITMDIYNIAKERIPDVFKSSKNIIYKRIEDKKGNDNEIYNKDLENKSYFITGVLDDIIFQLEKNKEINHSPIFHFVKSFIKSAVSLEKGEFDNISEKNSFCLIILGYCCLECFSYLLKNEKENVDYLKRSFAINNYENIRNYLIASSLDNSTKSVFNTFQHDFYAKNGSKIKTKEDKENIYQIFLKSIKQTDFKINYNNYKKKIDEIKRKKNIKKKYSKIK